MIKSEIGAGYHLGLSLPTTAKRDFRTYLAQKLMAKGVEVIFPEGTLNDSERYPTGKEHEATSRMMGLDPGKDQNSMVEVTIEKETGKIRSIRTIMKDNDH